VAERTLRCLRRCVPAAVPGIVFLSGGQSSEDATAHLDAMNSGFGPHPWALSFSYGRALQDQALKAWRGQQENWGAAQERLLRRAKLNSMAARGRYPGEAAA
jgi:fructose-bisphosphate aldolase, class I